MKEKTTNVFFAILIIVAISLIFSVIVTINFNVAAILSLGLLILSIMIIYFPRINEKQFFLFFFFIYPLLPGLWGINLPFGLPVLRAHRVATVILILYLIRNGLFLHYYTNFIKTRLFNSPIFFIILSMIISSFLSSAVGASFFFTISFILESIILGVVVYNAFPTREDIESLISVICFSALILCFIGLYEDIFEFNIYTLFGSYMDESTLEHVLRNQTVRINGPFIHPISFGTYFAMILPLVLYKFRKSYIKFYFLIVLFFYIIMETESRGAQIGAIMALIMYFIFIERKNIGIILFFSIPFIIGFHKRINNYFTDLNPLTTTDPSRIASSTERIRQINFYSGVIKEKPIFGYGLEEAPPLMRGRLDGSEGNYQNTIDNFYLGYSYQYGIVGLVTWIYFMIEVIRKPIKVYGKDIFKDKLLVSLLISIMIFNVVNYIAFLWHYHFLFWIYLGIITRLIVIKRNELLSAPTHETIKLSALESKY